MSKLGERKCFGREGKLWDGIESYYKILHYYINRRMTDNNTIGLDRKPGLPGYIYKYKSQYCVWKPTVPIGSGFCFSEAGKFWLPMYSIRPGSLLRNEARFEAPENENMFATVFGGVGFVK